MQNAEETAKHVSSCLQLAILLEVSAQKPGNVNRTVGFPDTRYEHFLASAVAVEPAFARATKRGILAGERRVDLSKIGVGRVIREAVANVKLWQSGGNTLLGTVLLLSPVAAAAGITLARKREFSPSELRDSIRLVVESTTPADAVEVYEAISIANPNGLIDKTPELDVNDPDSRRRIIEEGINLLDIFKISAAYDTISKEWVENYPMTFDLGLPYFTQQLREKANLDMAIVHTFLRILSEFPDTLIARKAGWEEAREVSEKARETLSLGGLTTPAGRDKLSTLDNELRAMDNQLNPGTTADIVAAVLAVSILNGYRP